jgi:hypothetical protein
LQTLNSIGKVTLQLVKLEVSTMKALQITQAKPNPSGKDRGYGDIPASQLGGEWVDYRNTGSEPYDLESILLQHVAYTPQYPSGVWQKVSDFSGILPVGEVVRVHSGAGPESQLKLEDRIGANYHIFTGKGYVWNNSRADTARLVNSVSNLMVDKASYQTNPVEGKILKRSGEWLV